MLVSIKWLEELLKTKLNLNDLKKIALNLGMEVEQDSYLGPQGAVVGRVREVLPHPKRSDLCVLRIKTKDELQIVSADTRLKVNDLVLVVPAGETFKGRLIEKRDFGGIESNGILISEEELGLVEKSTGVIVLDKGREGKKFGDLFDDLVIEVKIPTNRPDLLSVIGMAREFAIGLGKEFFAHTVTKQINHTNKEVVKLIERDGCPRYTARIFEDLKITESPFSIKWRLFCMGMKGINNVVDITNLNMLLYGQPLHPFDMDLLNGPIIIRRAKRGEDFITLDGTHFKLEENDLVIADKDGPIALAGIIGSKRAEISKSTRRVLLESAYFNPRYIAHTRRRLGIQTEASLRFERGADLSMVDEVSRITGEHFKNLAQAKEGEFISEGIKAKERSITFSLKDLNTILSLNLTDEAVKNWLKKSNIQITGKNILRAKLPHHRSDLQIEADIYEELARIYGYEKIPETPPNRWAHNKPFDKNGKIIKFLRDCLVGRGFNEVYNLSFVHSRRLLEFGFQDFVRIKNPLNERFDALRPTLFFGLLDTLEFNLSKGNHSIKLFEIGNVLLKREPFEEKRLGVIMGGELNPDFWDSGGKRIDFYDAKGTVEGIFQGLRLMDFDFEISPRPGFSQALRIFYSNEELGFLGTIDKDIVKPEFFYFELFLSKVLNLIHEPFYIPPGKFPANIRDLSFLFDEGAGLSGIKKLIRKTGGPILEKVTLFDYYKGENLPPGKKNLGFRLYFKASDRTLTDQEVDVFVEKIVKEVTGKFNAQLRKKEKM
uniref:Phenylalanine--tRNA ligase beta subunit n=1 Tax=candidate division WOR-3 bacterium TaxID=2052148 RepID=A0A7C4TE99_UNCW3